MKVVFLESVEGTAQVGETKEVKNGFARNYLLPRGLAAPAVEPYLQRAQARAAREMKRQQELDRDANTIAERLEGSRIEIIARVGEQGKLYGSVTSVHIAAEVAKLIGDEEFDHRKVLVPEAIREIGVQPIRLRLTRNVEAVIELEVIAEVDEEEEAAAAEAAAAGEAEAAPEEAEASTEEQPEAASEEAEASSDEEPEAASEEAEASSDEEPEAASEEAEASADDTVEAEEEETKPA
ncbi:MAG: 50S ribosomal protein L9 [Chloroflexi bacterium]|nr:50S ribosomal protein L9 [Chloroflexota bacterium]